jgi:lysophospholipase L1-like esterase
VALGCSYTQGIGLPIQTLWPSIVGEHLGLKVYNLGIGGGSADTCFMLGQYWIPVLRPKLVVMAAPPQSRIDILPVSGSPQVNTIMPNTIHGEFGNDNFIKHWFANERNQQLNNAKNKLAIKALSNNFGIPCLTYNAHDWFAKSREEVGYARDLMHAGPQGHAVLAKKILDDFATN